MNKKRIQQIKCLFTLFFVVCASFYATRSYAQNNAVTIRLSGVSMERVMNEIENQTNYLFLSNKDVDINSVVSVDVEARPLSEALAQMVRGTDVVYRFDGTIAQMAVLAVLMPMVANQGGNSGQQALAVMIRQLASEKVDRKKAIKAVLREGKIGFITGFAMAIVAFIGSWIFSHNMIVGMVMGGAMLCDMVLGAVAGGSIPLIFKALGRDPAQASSIFLTTITDGCGFFIFLGLATVFLF